MFVQFQPLISETAYDVRINSTNHGIQRIPGVRPEELPPVKPPSAGFIVSTVPDSGAIVMAVVAVWALFGQLAHLRMTGSSLLQPLAAVTDSVAANSPQKACVWRNEELSPPTDREPLAKNPVVADSLTEMLSQSLASTTNSD